MTGLLSLDISQIQLERKEIQNIDVIYQEIKPYINDIFSINLYSFIVFTTIIPILCAIKLIESQNKQH